MKLIALLPFMALCHGFTMPQTNYKISLTALNMEIQESDSSSSPQPPSTRRQFATSAALGLMGVASALAGGPQEALASGGATAGKYT